MNIQPPEDLSQRMPAIAELAVKHIWSEMGSRIVHADPIAARRTFDSVKPQALFTWHQDIDLSMDPLDIVDAAQKRAVEGMGKDFLARNYGPKKHPKREEPLIVLFCAAREVERGEAIKGIEFVRFALDAQLNEFFTDPALYSHWKPKLLTVLQAVTGKRAAPLLVMPTPDTTMPQQAFHGADLYNARTWQINHKLGGEPMARGSVYPIIFLEPDTLNAVFYTKQASNEHVDFHLLAKV